MPKQKTNKACAKRFRLTASGKLKTSRVGRRHLLSSKSGKRRRQLQRAIFLRGPLAKEVRRLLG